MESSVKEEARIGHKSADSSFYGYKEHFAMTDERIITACVVTSGEKSDGPVLEELYHKSKDNGVTIEAIVGDRATLGRIICNLPRKNVCIESLGHIQLFQKAFVGRKMSFSITRTQVSLFVQKGIWH